MRILAKNMSFVERQVRKYQRGRKYDLEHNRNAKTIVETIQNDTGRNFTNAMKRQCDEYAMEILGSIRFAPWLYVYTLVSGKFSEGWMPDNFFGRLVIPNINKQLRVVSEYKTFSKAILKTEAIPDIGYYVDGVLYDGELSVVNIDHWRRLVSEKYSDVFVKKDKSRGGEGILKLSSKDLSLDSLHRIGNCAIQMPVKQHPFFEEIVERSVGTIRITTVRENTGSIGVRAACLRVGKIDDAWVRSHTHLRICILDLEVCKNAGRLDSVCYTKKWLQHDRHPDTGTAFEGRVVPKFKEAVELCKALHRNLPSITVVGWDVTVDDSESVRLLEWNTGHCTIRISEAVTGPCFLGLNWEQFRP